MTETYLCVDTTWVHTLQGFELKREVRNIKKSKGEKQVKKRVTLLFVKLIKMKRLFDYVSVSSVVSIFHSLSSRFLRLKTRLMRFPRRERIRKRPTLEFEIFSSSQSVTDCATAMSS